MHFTYDQNPSFEELFQGDVLARTPEIDAVLKEVHPHFFHKSKNLFFMVLTQSCDLVIRPNGVCKSSYITIAPVRSLDSVLVREIDGYKLALESDAPILTDKSKSKLSEFLQRLFNNNEPGYFYLDSAETELPEDCCAYLNLSISLKTSEHFAACVRAKRLQLHEAFQAKLGWLVAQMFSRVGTRDWEQRKLVAKIQTTLKDAGIFVPDSKVKDLQKILEGEAQGGVAAPVTAAQIKSALARIPSQKKLVISRASELLQEALSGRPDQQQLKKLLISRLESDAAMTSMLNRS